jgi:hypothetical protein
LFEGDYIYIRASSLYYTEAEALARQGREAEARQVLYEITSQRNKAYSLSSKSGNELINEIHSSEKNRTLGRRLCMV